MMPGQGLTFGQRLLVLSVTADRLTVHLLTCPHGEQARTITADSGVLGLYRGFWPTLLRDVPEIAIQFTLYERCGLWGDCLLSCTADHKWSAGCPCGVTCTQSRPGGCN